MAMTNTMANGNDKWQGKRNMAMTNTMANDKDKDKGQRLITRTQAKNNGQGQRTRPMTHGKDKWQ